MREFVQGFIKGARETPMGFFAPAIALWRLLVEVSDSLTSDKSRRIASDLDSTDHCQKF
jgi:hypothetical protein